MDFQHPLRVQPWAGSGTQCWEQAARPGAGQGVQVSAGILKELGIALLDAQEIHGSTSSCPIPGWPIALSSLGHNQPLLQDPGSASLQDIQKGRETLKNLFPSQKTVLSILDLSQVKRHQDMGVYSPAQWDL